RHHHRQWDGPSNLEEVGGGICRSSTNRGANCRPPRHRVPERYENHGLGGSSSGHRLWDRRVATIQCFGWSEEPTSTAPRSGLPPAGSRSRCPPSHVERGTARSPPP